MNSAQPLPTEVLTDVLAFLPYKHARTLVPLSKRCSRILANQINQQLQPILDICTALISSCCQLDDQIDSITDQLQPFIERKNLLDEQYRRELNRGQPMRQLFLVIFQRQKLLAEIEAIHEHFRPQLAQLSLDSFPLRIQILRLKIKKAKTKMGLKRWEHFIQCGEIPPNQTKPKRSESFGLIDLLKLIIAFCPILLYAIVYV